MKTLPIVSFTLISPTGKSKTPTRTPGGDRFIPNRSATNFDLGNFKLQDQSTNIGENTDPALMMSPSKLEYQKAMAENLNGDLMNSKILCYKNKPPNAPEGRLIYSCNSFIFQFDHQIFLLDSEDHVFRLSFLVNAIWYIVVNPYPFDS